MLESVLHQTYGNWELCLVDGSQAKGEPPVLDARVSEDGELSVLEKVYSLETERIIWQYMENEPRIQYIKWKKILEFPGTVTGHCRRQKERMLHCWIMTMS